MTPARPRARWHVYIVRCGDGTLYTGIATDVSRRFAEHRDEAGKGAKYLRGRAPLALVLSEPVGARGLALRVESRIKKLSKTGKEALIAQGRGVRRLVLDEKRRQPSARNPLQPR